MKPTHLLVSVALAATLAACSTTMPNTESAGYLSSYAGLETTPNNSLASLRSAVKLDPRQVQISDVTWRAKPGADVSPREQKELLLQLRHNLIQELHKMPAQEGGKPALVRAAITRIETVSPVLNTLGTLLLIGPLDRGGIAVEIEAVDPDTGKQLAAMRLGYFTPITELAARFSKLAPAEIALERAAADFSKLLVPAAAVQVGSL